LPLKSRDGAEVSIRVQGQDGAWSSWSAIYVEAGLLERSEWTAVPITNPSSSSDVVKRPFRVRSTFTVSSTSRARLYITALGLYEAYLNGKRIGQDLFTPGWTSYHARLAYQTYDVTDLLVEGENILGAWVGEGWYAGVLGYGGGTGNIYGDRIGLIAQLELDGKPVVSTDGQWEWSYGAVLSSELYNGETYDTSLPDTDCTQGEWSTVETLPVPSSQLFSSQSPPVRIASTIKSVELITTLSGQTIIDFGQNIAGAIRILTDPPRSSKELVIRYAEVLEHAELGTRPLRYAKATETIALSGRSIKGYTPKFTSHGFRYAEITYHCTMLKELSISHRWKEVVISRVRTIRSTSCTRTAFGPQSAIPLVSPRTARSEMNDLGGPATFASFPRPCHTCLIPRDSWENGSKIWSMIRSGWAVSFLSSFPILAPTTHTPKSSGEMLLC
jgi:alpha-L-rhamnosidase